MAKVSIDVELCTGKKDCFRSESQSKRVEMKENTPDIRKSPIPCKDIFRLLLKIIFYH